MASTTLDTPTLGTTTSETTASDTPKTKRPVLYKLVHFVDDKDDGSVDFVPTHWIHYDTELDDICTRFMPPPYNERNSAELHSMIRCRISPPELWPKFRVEIRGAAATHEEAAAKVEAVKNSQYAFSSDCEDGRVRSLNEKKIYMKKKVAPEAEIQDLMKVPSLSENATLLESDLSCSSDLNESRTRNSEQPRHRRSRNCIESDGDDESDEFASLDRTVVEKTVQKSDKGSKNTSKADKKVVLLSSRIVRPAFQNGTERQTSVLQNASTLLVDTATTSTALLVDEMPENVTPSKTSTALMGNEQSENVTSKASTTSTVLAVDQILGNHTPKSSRASTASAPDGTSKQFEKLVITEKDDLKAIFLKSHLSLSRQLSQMTTALGELQIMLMESLEQFKSVQPNAVLKERPLSLAESLDLNFPLQDEPALEKLESALKNPDVKNRLKIEMRYLLEQKRSLTRNISNILKKYIGRDLLRSHTAVKKTATKKVFKSTTFWQCVQELLTSEHANDPEKPLLTDALFNDALGAVINSAKDWDGHRLLRAAKD